MIMRRILVIVFTLLTICGFSLTKQLIQKSQTPPPTKYLLISQDQGDKTQVKKEWFKDKSTAEEKRKQLRANYFDVIIVSEEQASSIKV